MRCAIAEGLSFAYRSYEDQFYRASGLNLVVAAIVVWNTVYIEKAVDHLKQQGMDIPEEYLQHLSPLGVEIGYVNSLFQDAMATPAEGIATEKLDFIDNGAM